MTSIDYTAPDGGHIRSSHPASSSTRGQTYLVKAKCKDCFGPVVTAINTLVR